MNGAELLKKFPEIWTADFEYRQPDNERPDVHCLAARELKSGRTLKLWRDELGSRPPYPLGEDTLFVSYNLAAEFSCHLVLGWELPARCLDLLVEFRMMTSGTNWREQDRSKHQLIHALQYFGLNPLAAEEKAEWREVAIRGKPFTADERRGLLDYCAKDARADADLLAAMAPHIPNGLQALQRGRYVKTVARSAHIGIPLDAESLGALAERREDLIQSQVDEVNQTFDVYQKQTFKMDRMEALVAKHNLDWPRLESGGLNLQKETWDEMAERHSFLEPLRDCIHLVKLLRKNGLAVGSDGRSRATIFPFGCATGRNTWKAAQFVFAQPAYLRGLIQPPPGKALSYIDFAGQEILVAAALSGDANMLASYQSGDPYAEFGRLSGLAAERAQLKVCFLAVNYLISVPGLAKRLNLQPDYAESMIAAHKRTYPKFWRWRTAVIDQAMQDGFQETGLGWRTTVRDGWRYRNVAESV